MKVQGSTPILSNVLIYLTLLAGGERTLILSFSNSHPTSPTTWEKTREENQSGQQNKTTLQRNCAREEPATLSRERTQTSSILRGTAVSGACKGADMGLTALLRISTGTSTLTSPSGKQRNSNRSRLPLLHLAVCNASKKAKQGPSRLPLLHLAIWCGTEETTSSCKRFVRETSPGKHSFARQWQLGMAMEAGSLVQCAGKIGQTKRMSFHSQRIHGLCGNMSRARHSNMMEMMGILLNSSSIAGKQRMAAGSQGGDEIFIVLEMSADAVTEQ